MNFESLVPAAFQRRHAGLPTLLLACSGLLPTPVASAQDAGRTSADDKAAVDGFRHVDRGFAGQFEDVLATRLVMEVDGRNVRGTLASGGDWSVTAESRGKRLVGRATQGAADEPFEAAWDEDQLVVTLGKDEPLRLARTYVEDPRIADLGPVVEDPERRWTIAVYLGGDNDLELPAMLDLEELRTSIPEKGVELIVLLDRAQGHFEEPDGWTDAHVFRLRAGAAGAPILKELGEIDTADGRTLASFLTGAFRTFPAPHQAVVVWDHGSGWTGIVVDEDIPGAPAGARDMLDLGEVRTALRTAAWHTGRAEFDFLAFDACLMAQLEVALAVRDYAKWLVASETIVPGFGFPYERVLPAFADASKSPRDVAVDVVAAFAESYELQRAPGTTISAIDLSRVNEVARRLDLVSAKLANEAERHWPAIVRALYYSEAYEARIEREESGVNGSRDLLDLLHRIERGITPFPATSELRELEAELAAAVVASRVGDRRRGSHGLAVYAPYRADQWKARHETTPLGGANRFARLVRDVHQRAIAGSREPVTFEDIVVRGHESAAPSSPTLTPVVRPFDGNVISFTLTGNSIVAVEQWDCVRDGPGYVILRRNWVPDPAWMKRVQEGATDEADLFMPVFRDGRNELAIELLGMQYRVTNDEIIVNATLDVTAPSIDGPILARARMTAPGAAGPIDVEVRFDRALWHAAEVVPLDPAGTLGEPRSIQPTPEHVFEFAIEVHGDDGSIDQVYGTPIPWKRGIGLVLGADEAGDYRSVLHARTMDGRVSSARVDYQVEDNPDLAAWVATWRDFDPSRMPGRWLRQVAVGPGTWMDIDAPTQILPSPDFAPGIFNARSEFGPADARETIGQLWVFDTRGVPNLRIVSSLEGDRSLAWYGPAALGRDGMIDTITFKAINIGGMVFRWRRDAFDALKLEPRK